LRQQNLAPRRREDVPDGLLFEDDAAKMTSQHLPAGVEALRIRPGRRRIEKMAKGRSTAGLGNRGRRRPRQRRCCAICDVWKTSPPVNCGGASSQTVGQWRLYYQGARSVSEQFFEIDLAMVLAISGHDGGLFALSEQERRH